MKVSLMLSVKRSIVVCVGLAFLTGPWGCASPGSLPATYALPSRVLSPPPSDETRAALGTIGIASPRFVPEVEFTTLADVGRAKAAAKGVGGVAAGGVVGALYGAAAIAGGCVGTGPAAGFCALIVLGAAAIGAAIGAGAGAVGGAIGLSRSVPESTPEQVEAAARAAVAGLKMQEAMEGHLTRRARAETSYRFVALGARGVRAFEEDPSYQSLAREGIDTILEISVQKVALAGEGGADPLLALLMTARGRLVRTGGGAVLYAQELEYRGGTQRLSEWTAEGGRLSAIEFDRAYATLAEKIVDEMFLLHLPGGRI